MTQQDLKESRITGRCNHSPLASSYSSMHQTLLLPAFPCEPQDIACSYSSVSQQEQSHLKVVPPQVSNSNILQLSWCQFQRWTSHASGARFGQLCDSWARHLQCAHHLVCLLSNSSTLPGAPPTFFFSMVLSGIWEVSCFGGDHGCLQTHKYTVVSRKLFFFFL